MKYFKAAWWVVIISILSLPIQAQSPYQFNWKTDGSLLAIGGISSGLGIYYRSTLSTFDASDLEGLKTSDVNGFDRLATDFYSTKADRASDYFWISSHALPLVFLAGQNSRKDFGHIAAMYGEVFLINSGITLLTKTTFRRTRPFVYNPDAPLDKKMTKNARSSFVSGHTSMTAANCYFAATLFADYYPESNWKPAIWATAAIVPAFTGYLRVKAGKHYPTDTIAGYILGAVTGYLVPQLHRKKMERVSFYGELNGVLIQIQL